MDVGSFLRLHPPFDSLDEERIARVVSAVEIEHFPPGAVILVQAGAPATHLYVVRKGEVEIVDDGRVIDQVGEGEVFGMWSLLGHVAPSATVRATDDTLCYLVPAEVAEEVLETGSGVAFVAANVRRRVAAIERSLTGEVDPGRYRPVGSLVRRAAVTCEPETSVAAAAELMARERVSSLLVPSPESGVTGILTDRDLRSRVVAQRRAPDTRVREVMTPDVETVPADAMAGEVLLRMLERGFHHFPVADAEGRIVGVVTDTDLMGIGRDTPFALKSAIERAADPAAVASALRGLPRVVGALVDASADPVDVGHVVGFSIDAATRRLLELATAELGEAPATWAWLALGSAARQEQALRTDQDHALAFEGDAAAAPYLARLAEAVTAGLEAGGIPRCRADAMATNAAMRLPLEAWVRRFESWMREASPTGSEQLSIAFDYRRVAGALDAEPSLDEAMRGAGARPLFLRHLARRALDEKPPTGFVRDLVVEPKGEHAGTVDVKHGGIVIITNLARAYAVRTGLSAKRTLDRLRGAEAAGSIDAETREGLEEAFRFLWEVRLRHQVERARDGLEPDDFVDPHELGSVARQGLKEAFRIAARAQRALALEAGLSAR
jgi:CBS domain-containing protein